ncbi:uncharacterized protein SEPMUDRAFT_67198 [Sphaerulina musiva SO2202]|uniref:ORC6 first cyclin-like domain-containing protein n=1 Tax=Sphaerulina musiva (strain SO2202) TaxID=692275 RepID=N1QF55_SPHMS|nr:uncharacterized protein SEPMUDRAFT_67198 [Sphaerulina musiva SO2202]EMF11858.1 hypothetical protein SEPMUDRAFT_67198 [Sphaerulina musiva SO2202]
MPSPTETALSTLLPTISFLPPDLISLANSLLAQSRSKAASLKPEEEIGRIYAVAHIAAERLKKRLDLDLDRPKPPCPPRVYKKLYTYLDAVLSTPSTTPRTDRKRDALASTPKSSKSHGAIVTPGNRTRQAPVGADGVPDFVMSLVRAMCKATRTPKATPHVVVGAGAVVKELASRVVKRGLDSEPAAKRRRRMGQQQAQKGKEIASEDLGDAVATEKWPALTIALHTYTVARMRGIEADVEEMTELQEQARDAVEHYCIQNAAALPKELGSITMESLRKPLDFYMLEAEDGGWLDMDWYRNVPENIDDGDEDARNDDNEDDEMEDKGPDDLGAAGLLPGLGTMFQPAIDWLSDERRAEYASWKRGILEECARIETSA